MHQRDMSPALFNLPNKVLFWDVMITAVA